jgi:hypothetical protein
MDVKQVVGVAKDYVKDLFASEGIFDLGLEEVEFDENAKRWNVTIGFSRPWDKPVLGTTISEKLAALAERTASPKRSYKIVRIDDVSGQVLALKNRESNS